MKVDSGLLPPSYARVVLDTHVILSAALSTRGAPATLTDRLLQHGRLVFSEATFAELETRLWRPKFDRYLTLERRQRLLHDLNAAAHWVEVPAALAAQRFSRDASDDAFIHAAMAAASVRLITGDDDLLCLHPLGRLQIITPRAARTEIEPGAGEP